MGTTSIHGSTLLEYVESRSGAVSLTEACAWAVVNDYDCTTRQISALHSELGGRQIGRSRLVTSDIAAALERRLGELRREQIRDLKAAQKELERA